MKNLAKPLRARHKVSLSRGVVAEVWYVSAPYKESYY